MLRLIRAFPSVFVAALVATSILMSPANAVAMIGCDTEKVVSAAHVHEHPMIGAAHDHDSADDAAADRHFSEHCASHSCILALHQTQLGDGLPFMLRPVRTALPDASLVDLSDPDGLRRPPRT